MEFTDTAVITVMTTQGAINGLVKDTTELGVDGRRVRLTKLGPGKLLAVLGGEKREASEKIIPRQ